MISKPTFQALYWTVIAAALGLFACLPFSRQLSFWVGGFDPSLIEAASTESFRAYRETAGVRVALFWACAWAIGAAFLVSILALARRRRHEDHVGTLVPMLVMGVTLILASVLLLAYVAPHGPLV